MSIHVKAFRCMSLWTACPKILHIARYLISIVIQVHYDHLPGNKHTLYIMIIYQETSIHYDHLPGNKHTLYIMIIYQEKSIHYDLEISYQENNKIHEQLNYNDPYDKNKTKFTPSMLTNKLHHRCKLIYFFNLYRIGQCLKNVVLVCTFVFQ